VSSTDVQTIRSAYEAFARQDIEAVLSALDPEIEWVDSARDAPPPAGGGTRHGAQTVAAEVFPALAEHWTRFEVQPDRYLDAGDHVVVLGRFSGDADGGGSLDAPFVHVWRMSGGGPTGTRTTRTRPPRSRPSDGRPRAPERAAPAARRPGGAGASRLADFFSRLRAPASRTPRPRRGCGTAAFRGRCARAS